MTRWLNVAVDLVLTVPRCFLIIRPRLRACKYSSSPICPSGNVELNPTRHVANARPRLPPRATALLMSFHHQSMRNLIPPQTHFVAYVNLGHLPPSLRALLERQEAGTPALLATYYEATKGLNVYRRREEH